MCRPWLYLESNSALNSGLQKGALLLCPLVGSPACKEMQNGTSAEGMGMENGDLAASK